MKIVKAILTGILSLSLGNIYADEGAKIEHYMFHYESGDSYDIQITKDTITWTGVEGSDTGLTETDAIKRRTLSSDVEVIQWNEQNTTFITIVLDRLHHKVISSGKIAGNEWLSYGEVEEK